MTHPRWKPPRLAAALAATVLAAAACTDRQTPADPGGKTPVSPPPSSTPIELARVKCVASVREKSVECAPADTAAQGGASADLLYGGQGVFVRITSSNVEYATATEKFTFDVRVRNLIEQAVGTTDGVSADAGGVKLFFHQEPTVTAGSGVIAIDNADGTGTFTASGQPYFSYVTLLDPYEQSAPKTWQLSVPATVQSFEFTLFVSSPVQYPGGWIEVSHPTYALRRTYEKAVTGIVRDPYGRIIPGAAISWSSADPSRASVTPDGSGGALVLGHLPGAVNVVATSSNGVFQNPGASQTGTAAFTILGTQLVWTAGAASTDWNAPGNWDRGVAPLAPDTVTVPVVGPALYPVLTQNQQVGRVTVADGAQINLGAFDLTVGYDAVSAPTTGSGGIFSTTGRLILTGPGVTVAGTVPRTRVTGTYTLTGNVNTVAPLRVERGRIRNHAFRLRVNNQ